MDVIGYQLFILFTIGLSFSVWGPRPALLVAVFWTFWTIFMVYASGLFVVQLFTVWGTYFGARAYSKSRTETDNVRHAAALNEQNARLEISELRKALEGYPFQMRNKINDAAESSRVDTIAGDTHRPELESAIDNASRNLVILSGWIGSAVVTDQFISRLAAALSRNVSIFIGYGWEDSRGSHSDNQSVRTALNRLISLRKQYPDLLTIAKFANHQKILIKDFDYIICGSNN